MKKIRSHSKDPYLIDKQRKTIISAALKVFMKTGFDTANMRQIATAAGMTPGNIYHYIGTKKDILYLSCQYTKEKAESFNANLKASESGDKISDLKNALAAFYKMCDESANQIVIYTREQTKFSNEDLKALREAMEASIYIFQEIISTGNDKGLFNVEEPQLLARQIVFSGYDWSIRRIYYKEFCDLEKYTEQQQKLYLCFALKKERCITEY